MSTHAAPAQPTLLARLTRLKQGMVPIQVNLRLSFPRRKPPKHCSIINPIEYPLSSLLTLSQLHDVPRVCAPFHNTKTLQNYDCYRHNMQFRIPADDHFTVWFADNADVERTEKLYTEFIEELVRLAEVRARELQWRSNEGLAPQERRVITGGVRCEIGFEEQIKLEKSR